MLILLSMLILVSPIVFSMLFKKKNILQTLIFILFLVFGILIIGRSLSFTFTKFKYLFYLSVALSCLLPFAVSIIINKKQTFVVWTNNIKESYKSLIWLYVALLVAFGFTALFSHIGSDSIAYSWDTTNFKFNSIMDKSIIYSTPTYYYAVSVIGDFQLSYSLLTSIFHITIWTVAFMKIFNEFRTSEKKWMPIIFVILNTVACLTMRVAVGSVNITLIAIIIIVGFAIRKQGITPILVLPFALLNFSTSSIVAMPLVLLFVLLFQKTFKLRDVANILVGMLLFGVMALVLFIHVTPKIYLLILPVGIIWAVLNVIKIPFLEKEKTFKEFSNKTYIFMFIGSLVFQAIAIGMSIGLSHVMHKEVLWWGKIFKSWLAYAISIALVLLFIILKSKISNSLIKLMVIGLVTYGAYAILIPLLNLATFIPNRITDELWVSVILIGFFYGTIKYVENPKMISSTLVFAGSVSAVVPVTVTNLWFEGSNLSKSNYSTNFRWIQTQDMNFVRSNASLLTNKKVYGDLPWFAFSEIHFSKDTINPPHGIYRQTIGQYEKIFPEDTKGWGIVELNKTHKLSAFIKNYDFLIIKDDEYKKILDGLTSQVKKVKSNNNITIYKVI